MKKILLFATLGFVLIQCESENFQDKYGDVVPDCDTTAVSFSTDIEPIMAEYCVSCHNTASPFGGLDLSIYSGVKSAADNGDLADRITRSSSDALKMPPGENLGDCNINTIIAWVDQGALEN